MLHERWRTERRSQIAVQRDRRRQGTVTRRGIVRRHGCQQRGHNSRWKLLDSADAVWPGTVLLEVKTKAGKATEAQEASSALGWPVQTVRSIDDALFAIEPAL